MTKGSYLAKGEAVKPALFAAFPDAIPKDVPMNRLAAARWIVSPGNPLTARVAVNRFWAQLFGIGIVESEVDMLDVVGEEWLPRFRHVTVFAATGCFSNRRFHAE